MVTSGTRLNYSGKSRYGEGKDFTFGSNKYLEIYLALQAYTGLNQKDLLKWIDDTCDRLEAKFDLTPKRFNRRTKGRANFYGKTTIAEAGGDNR